MNEPPTPLLVITGPVGVGKTTVANEVSNLLAQAGVPHACIDLDALRSAYPPPPGDRFNLALGLRNLAAIWTNYRAAGAERLVLADVVESRSELDGYRQAVPGALATLVRLSAPVTTLQQRVRGRELGAGLEWHVARAAELQAQMQRDALEDHLVETGGKDPVAVARAVLAACGWPGG